MPDEEPKPEDQQADPADDQQADDAVPPIPPEDLPALLELHRAAKAAGMTPAQLHNNAYQWQVHQNDIVKQQDEKMFREHSTEGKNGNGSSLPKPDPTKDDDSADDYITRKGATELAAEIAARTISQYKQQDQQQRQLDALHESLAQNHKITDPIMRDAARAYAERMEQQQGMNPAVAYAQFAASAKPAAPTRRVTEAVKNDAAMRPSGTRSGSSGGASLPKDTAKEPNHNRIDPKEVKTYDDVTRKMFVMP